MLQIYYRKMTADICIQMIVKSGLRDIDHWIKERRVRGTEIRIMRTAPKMIVLLRIFLGRVGGDIGAFSSGKAVPANLVVSVGWQGGGE